MGLIGERVGGEDGELCSKGRRGGTPPLHAAVPAKGARTVLAAGPRRRGEKGAACIRSTPHATPQDGMHTEQSPPPADAGRREEYLVRLMGPPNVTWHQILAQAKQDVEVLKQGEVIRNLQTVLQTNVSGVCGVGGSLGGWG